MIPVGNLTNEGDLEIYIQSNGVHTDLCFPYKNEWMDWRSLVPSTDFVNNKASQFIAIGWGDKGFFLDTPEWSDLTFSTAFNAAFLPSETAMHVTCFDEAPKESIRRVKIQISSEQYETLIAFTKASFAMDENQEVQLIPNSGYGHFDQFYEANGSYSMFYTCNTWTNEALQQAEIKTGWYALSSEGIMSHLLSE